MRRRLDEAARQWSAVARILRHGVVVDALFFDPAAYAEANQDVAQSIRQGRVRGAYEHYVRHGKWEGRRFEMRRWGLAETSAARLMREAAQAEHRLDALLCRLTWGELAHRLVDGGGRRLVKNLGPWKEQPLEGPWEVELPASMRQGGWYMVRLRVAPVRAPIALRFVGAIDGEPLALHGKATRAVQRLVWVPPGSERLVVSMLDHRIRAQPLRLRLRPVPDSKVEARMMRRLRHHHPRFLGRSEQQVRRELERQLGDDSAAEGALREQMWAAYESTFPAALPRASHRDWIERVEMPQVRELDATLEDRLAALTSRPTVSVLVPVFETDEEHLRQCIASVRAQSYPHWELCLVDDASPSPHVAAVLAEAAADDERIRVRRRDENGHICRASNDALDMATGELVALLDHDDLLSRHALLVAVEAVVQQGAELVYSDEDKLGVDGEREQPHFKPRFDPELLLGQNYVGHLVVARRERLLALGGFRVGYEGSQDHDLVLRLSEQLEPAQIVHVPWVLYHWRLSEGSTAARPDAKSYTAEAGINAVRAALERRGRAAPVEHAEVAHCYRVMPTLPEQAPSVVVVVPTRDALPLVSRCLTSLLAETRYPRWSVVVVDNGTREPEARRYLATIAEEPRVTVVRDDRPFNFSALNNRAVAEAEADLVCLLNNDTEIVDGRWLEHLAAHALREDVGCVGAKLLYPDRTIQHAGVLLGLHGLAGHPYRLMSGHHPGYYGRLTVTHAVSAVTAACLVVRRSVYQEVGGLDEALAVAFNDVDFCIRVRNAGYRNLLVPWVELIHHESATRGFDQDPVKRRRFLEEVSLVKRRWGSLLYDDPCYSPHLSLDHDDYSLRITG